MVNRNHDKVIRRNTCHVQYCIDKTLCSYLHDMNQGSNNYDWIRRNPLLYGKQLHVGTQAIDTHRTNTLPLW